MHNECWRSHSRRRCHTTTAFVSGDLVLSCVKQNLKCKFIYGQCQFMKETQIFSNKTSAAEICLIIAVPLYFTVEHSKSIEGKMEPSINKRPPKNSLLFLLLHFLHKRDLWAKHDYDDDKGGKQFVTME